MVSKVIDKISLFSKASGLTLNIRKCEILAVHSTALNSIANIPVKEQVKYLGVVIMNTPKMKAIQIIGFQSLADTRLIYFWSNPFVKS